MKRLITICAITLIAAGTASAGIYVNDRPGWESAVSVHGYTEEFFTDATLNPGVSVVTDYPGYVKVSTGVWWDRLVVPGQTDPGTGILWPSGSTTTWQFATPLIGFGANWDLSGPGGPGANIKMFLNGSLVGLEILNSTGGTFWGVTNGPFDTILLTSGSAGGAWCETYEMDNMVYAVPVPGAILLGILGLSVAGVKLRRFA